MDYQNIIVETRGKVGLVTLNRPKALNALNEVQRDPGLMPTGQRPSAVEPEDPSKAPLNILHWLCQRLKPGRKES